MFHCRLFILLMAFIIMGTTNKPKDKLNMSLIFKPKTSSKGKFNRPDSEFRNWITPNSESEFKAEVNRYHLYVSLACPWAHRTLIFRQLKSLENIISVSVVHPDMASNDWLFTHNDQSKTLFGTTGDTLYGKNSLRQVYPDEYSGIITVPVLWDKKQQCIVNNESSEIIRMFNSAFNDLTGNSLDFYPENLRPYIDKINSWVYDNINNAVYKTGFAGNQETYEKNCINLFETLDELDAILSTQRYLVADQITEADWRLVATLFRFDAVYHGHFKCNIKMLKEYKNIYGYMCDLYQHKGIKNTLNIAHIKRHYYGSHLSINPNRIVPIGDSQDWTANPNREGL